MATAPRFAALQNRVNAAAQAHLSNAAMELPGGGESVPVIFDAPYAAPFGDGVSEASQPVCRVPTERVSELRQGDGVLIDGESHTVERIEPDGSGWSVVTLYPAGA